MAEIQAELLGDNGIATEEVRHANLVSFTCLKALAFDQRNERKDAHVRIEIADARIYPGRIGGEA